MPDFNNGAIELDTNVDLDIFETLDVDVVDDEVFDNKVEEDDEVFDNKVEGEIEVGGSSRPSTNSQKSFSLSSLSYSAEIFCI